MSSTAISRCSENRRGAEIQHPGASDVGNPRKAGLQPVRRNRRARRVVGPPRRVLRIESRPLSCHEADDVAVVPVGERGQAPTLLRNRHAGDDRVKPAGPERRDQPFPVFADEGARRLDARAQRERDVEPDEPIRIVDAAERRTRGVYADAELRPRPIVTERGRDHRTRARATEERQRASRPVSSSWHRLPLVSSFVDAMLPYRARARAAWEASLR